MDSSAKPPEPTDDDVDALDSPEPTGGEATNVTDARSTTATASGAADVPPPKKSARQKLSKFNIYLLLFLLILIIAGAINGIAYLQSKKATTATVKSQTLSQNTLQQLASTNASVGDPKQVLNVESNAVFAGKVLVRDSLEIAGGLQVGGTVNFGSITVGGQGSFDQLQVNKNSSFGGDAAIQGSVTIQKSLQVGGGGTFTGPVSAPQVTTTNFQLNGDLILTHHVTAGGSNPKGGNGPALGSGGTASVSGSDTAGSISINTGSGPGAGCFVTITFATKYASTPHVIVTPVGSDAGGMAYYITRTSSSFSVCDAAAPPAGSNFGFDYFVVD